MRHQVSASLVVVAVAGFLCAGQKVIVTKQKRIPGDVMKAYGVFKKARTPKDYEHVLQMYQDAFRRHPDCESAASGIGECLVVLHRTEEAVAAYRRAVAVEETQSNQYQTGHLLRQLGRSVEAVPHLERAVALAPHYPLYSGDLGEALYEAGRYDDAILMLERHIRDRGERDPFWHIPIESGPAEERETALVESYAAKGMFREAEVVLGGRRWIGLRVKPQNYGVLVERVARNMPGDQAGIRPGDMLIRWKGMPLAGLGSVFGPSEEQQFQAVVQSAAIGDHVPVELNRGGQIQKVELFMGFKTAADRLSVKIQRLEVHPARVSAGAPFDVGVDYIVTDPAAGAGSVAVEFSCRILEGQKVLFSKPAAKLEIPNGATRRRTEQLTASPRKGTYTFQVFLRYGESLAQESVDFQIE